MYGYLENGTFEKSGFNQTARIAKAGLADAVPVSRNGGTEDVSEGACREFVRMWIWARNNPSATAGLGKREEDKFGLKIVAPEIALLKRHVDTIMAAQARVQAGNADYAPVQVAGLRENKAFATNGLTDVLERIDANNGKLAYLSVTCDGIGHAIAVDARDGDFILFDPNDGMWTRTADADREQFLEDYFRSKKYKLRFIITYD